MDISAEISQQLGSLMIANTELNKINRLQAEEIATLKAELAKSPVTEGVVINPDLKTSPESSEATA